MPKPMFPLTVEKLRVLVDEGEIDTVIVAFTDMQGRLQGKRLHAQFFLDTVLEHGTEGCNYLLAVDVDMNTVDGYAISSWSRGYGDMEFVLDLSTFRLTPWLPGTAMVQCDLAWLDEDHSPVLQSPRTILKAQADRAAGHGLVAYAGTELEFNVYNNTFEDAWSRRYQDLTPGNQYNVDYSLLGTSRVEPLLRDIRNHMYCRRAHGGVGQGRVQPRPARDRVQVRDRGAHGRPARGVQERRQGDRLAARPGGDVHGQVRRAGGQLLPHPHERAW